MAGQGQGSEAAGRTGSAARGAVGCGRIALCPELFRQRCCPGWSLPWLVPGLVEGCCWFQVAAGVGDAGSTGTSSLAKARGVGGAARMAEPPPQPALWPLPSSNLMAQACGLATKAAWWHH